MELFSWDSTTFYDAPQRPHRQFLSFVVRNDYLLTRLRVLPLLVAASLGNQREPVLQKNASDFYRR